MLNLSRIRARLRPPRRLKFTREGRYYVAISVGIGLAAINTGNNLLYLLLGWLLSVIIASGLLSEQVLRGLRIQRRPPPRVFAEQAFLMEISVENTKKSLASYSIEVEDQVSVGPLDKKCYFLKVPAGRTQRTSYRHTFARRGLYRFAGFRVGTKFPFALFRKSRDIDVGCDLVVFPKIQPVAVPAPRTHFAGHDTARQMGRRGEFFGLREYRDGDERRDIHWRSSARTGRALVREYEAESQKRVTVLLDNALPDDAVAPPPKKPARTLGKKADAKGDAAASELAEAMERTVSAAASLATAYLNKGYSVQLVARGCRVPFSSGPQQLTRILNALALLETVSDEVPLTTNLDPRIESVLFHPRAAAGVRNRPSNAAHVYPID
ncbi:DUF58 domain-containing protein [Haliangium ochraceum]|uniref:DUF58 domain-containing protein n=1 Tax=Haliangium ochraceum (strain DSM 14365 / JCM 11303 / SMP-2) TaxID=502025 RepID=D0LRQ9_HALO1|nr:DUF58 domain-containing protein [Haliangium ochraceum]ACY19051.1 protein of unknown function DUF58 [Haliangium ochraceum DSM 14365]